MYFWLAILLTVDILTTIGSPDSPRGTTAWHVQVSPAPLFPSRPTWYLNHAQDRSQGYFITCASLCPSRFSDSHYSSGQASPRCPPGHWDTAQLIH